MRANIIQSTIEHPIVPLKLSGVPMRFALSTDLLQHLLHIAEAISDGLRVLVRLVVVTLAVHAQWSAGG